VGLPEYEVGVLSIAPQHWDMNKWMNEYRSYNGLLKFHVYTNNIPMIWRNVLRRTGSCVGDLGGISHEI
jgi:hypothetical protein